MAVGWCSLGGRVRWHFLSPGASWRLGSFACFLARFGSAQGVFSLLSKERLQVKLLQTVSAGHVAVHAGRSGKVCLPSLPSKISHKSVKPNFSSSCLRRPEGDNALSLSSVGSWNGIVASPGCARGCDTPSGGNSITAPSGGSSITAQPSCARRQWPQAAPEEARAKTATECWRGASQQRAQL